MYSKGKEKKSFILLLLNYYGLKETPDKMKDMLIWCGLYGICLILLEKGEEPIGTLKINIE